MANRRGGVSALLEDGRAIGTKSEQADKIKRHESADKNLVRCGSFKMSSDLDIAKAGADAIMRPFSDLIDKLAGPAAEELGLALKDRIEVLRFQRQVRLWRRTQEMIKEAGFERKRVPFKSLAAVVENASMEDDNLLQDQWAALLANNAAGNYLDRVYPEILRQLSAADAQLLRMCFRAVLRAPYNRTAPPWANVVSPAIDEFNEARKRHQAWQYQ